MVTKKTVPFTKSGIQKLPNDKPGVYEIKNSKGDPEYVGMAKARRVVPRVMEHLPNAKDPVSKGKSVTVTPTKSKSDASTLEAKTIKREKPPVNKKGK